MRKKEGKKNKIKEIKMTTMQFTNGSKLISFRRTTLLTPNFSEVQTSIPPHTKFWIHPCSSCMQRV